MMSWMRQSKRVARLCFNLKGQLRHAVRAWCREKDCTFHSFINDFVSARHNLTHLIIVIYQRWATACSHRAASPTVTKVKKRRFFDLSKITFLRSSQSFYHDDSQWTCHAMRPDRLHLSESVISTLFILATWPPINWQFKISSHISLH